LPYIAPQVITEAKQLDLLTYLQNYDPHELVQVSGNEYCTRTHDSLRISNGLWHWCSRGIGGKSALDYLVKVKGLSFIEAAEIIIDKAAIMPPVFVPMEVKEKPKDLKLPPTAKNNDRAIRYLMSRGIDREVIEHCIDTGRLYESVYRSEYGRIFNQCVFVGHDSQGMAKYASIRGIGTKYKGEASGSDKKFSFAMSAQAPTNILRVFESAIDAISFATMMKMQGFDFRSMNLLSLGGIPPQQSNKVPIALTQYLSDNQHIKSIELYFDIDAPGRNTARVIMSQLQDDYAVIDHVSRLGKDVNDCLCRMKNIRTSGNRIDAR